MLSSLPALLSLLSLSLLFHSASETVAFEVDDDAPDAESDADAAEMLLLCLCLTCLPLGPADLC